MSVGIHVPELGESVADATISRWLKDEGEAVKSGETLVELETDKINFEVEAEQDGVLESISKGEGETVGVGQVMGVIGVSDGQPATQPNQGSGATSETRPEERSAAAGERVALASTGSATEGDSNRGREIKASPSVRTLAAEYSIDLASVEGSGSSERITKDDVEHVIREQSRSAPRSESPTSASERPSEAINDGQPQTVPPSVASWYDRSALEERVRFSRRRQTIAKRLVEAQRNAAMLTTFNEADMTAIMELRKRRKDEFLERHGVRLGFMSFFTKAAVGALKAFPQVNAELQDDELILKHYYDVGIAVSTGEGLVVPVVRDADNKGFAEIEQEIIDMANKGRSDKLKLEDLQGGTFTITNGGIFGNLLSTPILNTPQVGILGMHRIQERPIVVGGKIVARPMMYLALSYDHRVIDGAESVNFLACVRDFVQDPESLLLEG